MGYCYTNIEQETELEPIDDKDIENFKNKHKNIVDLFEGTFLNKDADGIIWILGEESFSLNSRDFPRLDDEKPNQNRARVKFFEGAKMKIYPDGTGGFSWGQDGFPKEFYDELAQLINEEVNFHAGNVDCGDSGYYSGNYSLYFDNGNAVFSAAFSYYEEAKEGW